MESGTGLLPPSDALALFKDRAPAIEPDELREPAERARIDKSGDGLERGGSDANADQSGLAAIQRSISSLLITSPSGPSIL